ITLIAPGGIILMDHPEKTVPYCIKAECELNGCGYNVGHVCNGSVCFFHSTHYDSGKSGFFIVLNDDSRTVRMVEGAYALFGQLLEGLPLADMLSRTGSDDDGQPHVLHRIRSIRVETHGREFPFETCPEPEDTLGKVIMNQEDSELSLETEI
ncbi:MAG: peptidylprolyl isomerase, partial [Clostridia bacterium]|nr:peptidylprolyl isomerase [Clostridia bacterium]